MTYAAEAAEERAARGDEVRQVQERKREKEREREREVLAADAPLTSYKLATDSAILIRIVLFSDLMSDRMK